MKKIIILGLILSVILFSGCYSDEEMNRINKEEQRIIDAGCQSNSHYKESCCMLAYDMDCDNYYHKYTGGGFGADINECFCYRNQTSMKLW